MEQDNKYFTPDISDLYVGYEYQWLLHNIDGSDYKWVDKVADTTNMVSLLWQLEMGHIRTPYLTIEDIESEGWKWDKDHYRLKLSPLYKDQSDEVWELWQYGKIINISNETSNRCFDGECKSVNEFRKIEKWIGIKND